MRTGSVLKKGLATCVLAGMFLVAIPQQVIAQNIVDPFNTVDTYYHFIFDAKHDVQSTENRWKDTSSSVYLRVVGRGGGRAKLYTDGGSSSGNSWANCTRGGYVMSPGVGKFEIHNFIRENGYVLARIRGVKVDAPFSMYGYWSPDCGGDYSDLN